MTPAEEAAARTRKRGGTGCVVGFCLVLVSVVLMLLGNERSTRELMPFGVLLLPIAMGVGVFGGVALTRYFTATTSEDTGPSVAGGAPAARPPAMVQCPQCGGAAQIRLADPTAGNCAFCRTRFPLPAELAHAVGHAASVLHQQAAAERQVEASIAELAAHEVQWTKRLRRTTTWLAGLGGAMALVGLLMMNVDHDWPYYVGTGLAGAAVAAGIGLAALHVVPPAVRNVVGRWSAIRLPGENGLGCRVCGGPLPALVAPVLRCTYCGADNLASGEVMAKVAATAQHAQRSVLAVAARRQRGDDLAAVALKSLPLVVGLAWIVVFFLANPVIGGILDVIELLFDVRPV